MLISGETCKWVFGSCFTTPYRRHRHPRRNVCVWELSNSNECVINTAGVGWHQADIISICVCLLLFILFMAAFFFYNSSRTRAPRETRRHTFLLLMMMMISSNVKFKTSFFDDEEVCATHKELQNPWILRILPLSLLNPLSFDLLCSATISQDFAVFTHQTLQSSQLSPLLSHRDHTITVMTSLKGAQFWDDQFSALSTLWHIVKSFAELTRFDWIC
jgi:hypothetical protein